MGHRNKGTDLFFKLAAEVHEEKHNGKSVFILIGPITDVEIKKMKTFDVMIPSPDNPLDRDEFEQYAARIDYAVFCYPCPSYRLAASGALFDAFSFAKPIIAIRNPFFEYYFEEMGDIGYLYDSYEEMKESIINIVDNFPADRYEQQRSNIIKNREKYSVQRLGMQFKELWKE